MDQTGANIQFGGLKIGLIKPRCQSFTALCVAKPDRKPIKRQIKMAMDIFTNFFFIASAVPVKNKNLFNPECRNPNPCIIFAQTFFG